MINWNRYVGDVLSCFVETNKEWETYTLKLHRGYNKIRTKQLICLSNNNNYFNYNILAENQRSKERMPR